MTAGAPRVRRLPGKLSEEGRCLKSLAWPGWGPLLHALSFSGRAVHLAADSGSGSRFAVGRRGPGRPGPDVARAGAKLRAVAVGRPGRPAVS